MRWRKLRNEAEWSVIIGSRRKTELVERNGTTLKTLLLQRKGRSTLAFAITWTIRRLPDRSDNTAALLWCSCCLLFVPAMVKQKTVELVCDSIAQSSSHVCPFNYWPDSPRGACRGESASSWRPHRAPVHQMHKANRGAWRPYLFTWNVWK